MVLNDGRTESRWTSESGALTDGKPHHVAVIVDGGPKIISFVVDGVFHDGGSERQFGWGRFSPNLMTVNGGPTLHVGPGVRNIRVYNRALRTSEAIAAFRAE